MPTAEPDHITAPSGLSALSRRTLLGAGTLVAAGGAALATAAQAASDPDAALIALCDRIVAIDGAREAIYAIRHSVEDERRTEHLLDAIFEEEQSIVSRIGGMPRPTTAAGLRAMARASLAIAPKNHDGSSFFDGGGTESLAHEIVRAIAAGGSA